MVKKEINIPFDISKLNVGNLQIRELIEQIGFFVTMEYDINEDYIEVLDTYIRHAGENMGNLPFTFYFSKNELDTNKTSEFNRISLKLIRNEEKIAELKNQLMMFANGFKQYNNLFKLLTKMDINAANLIDVANQTLNLELLKNIETESGKI